MPVSLSFMGLSLILVASILLRHHTQKNLIDFQQKSIWLICLLLVGIFIFLLSFFSLTQVLWCLIVTGSIFFIWDKIPPKHNIQSLYIQSLSKTIGEVLQKLLPWLLLLALSHSFLASFYYISFNSMAPTLKEGDIVVVLPKNSIYFSNKGQKESIQKGQVIVFRDIKQKINLIKRVIGIPGDTITYGDKTLLINGQKIKKKFINKILNTDLKKLSKIEAPHELSQFEQNIELNTFNIFEDENLLNNELLIKDKNCIPVETFIQCSIPNDQYFVLGDNRDHSLDSRHHGLINKKDIYGRAVFILMNISQFNRFFEKIR
ncbi:MAG: signal peptidase I [Neisseriaceae bacterium]|nr:MAG: signal peptidase I [Neisseriaceae bacterium]